VRDPLLGADRLVLVAGDPGALDLTERALPDDLAQRIERERAAAVHVVAEQREDVVPRRLHDRPVVVPQLVRGGILGPPVAHDVEAVELGGVRLLVAVRMPLVEPHVLPADRRHAVAEPLVGELVDHDRLVVGAVAP
jgi:hypothetical protein